MTEAQRYARALRSTTQRYRNGFMVYRTWRTHIDHLWAVIEAKGLRRQVLLQVTR